jgi:hypothetical protein
VTWEPEEEVQNRKLQMKLHKREERADFLVQFIEMFHKAHPGLKVDEIFDKASEMVDLCIDYLNETTGILD